MPCDDCEYYKPSRLYRGCVHLEESAAETTEELPDMYRHPGCVLARVHEYWQEAVARQGRIEASLHYRIQKLEEVRNAAEGLKYAVDNGFDEVAIQMYNGFLTTAMNSLEAFERSGGKKRRS